MKFLHDRIEQIGQDLADDLQARAPEIFVIQCSTSIPSV
jgi:hypothetical protein